MENTTLKATCIHLYVLSQVYLLECIWLSKKLSICRKTINKIKVLKGLLLIVSVIVLYVVGVLVFEGYPLLTHHLVAIIGNGIIFLLSTFVMLAGRNASSENRTQRFILGTTIQMLLALFFLLITKFKMGAIFKPFVLHFMILFASLLAIQAVWMVLTVRKKA